MNNTAPAYTFTDFLHDEGQTDVLTKIETYRKYEKLKTRVILFVPSIEHDQADIFRLINHLYYGYQIECFKKDIEPEPLEKILTK